MYYFFLDCKKIAFSTFPQQAIFFFIWGREGGSYNVDFTLLCCLLVFSLGEGLRLVALFDSRPSRFS